MTRDCRACGEVLGEPFLALGPSPIANAFLTARQLDEPEPRYPLDVYFCGACALVQIAEVPVALFDARYPYFSSMVESWLAHAERYVDMIIGRLGISSRSFVVEVASNDGYLLQYLVARGIPVLGVEPTANTAAAAVARGVRTEVAFFGRAFAERLVATHGLADLIIGNNVLAHVPDLNDFVAGLAYALWSGGTITLEVPHLLRLMQEVQFDTIYHEHYSYLSLLALERLFARHALEMYDVEELPTHGGSVRLYVGAVGAHSIAPAVAALITRERAEGLDGGQRYVGFQGEVDRIRDDLVRFLGEARAAGKTVVGYGAPAKGNTLLNYCGVTRELLPFTVDRSPHKQGLYLPGTHLPILGPEAIDQAKPDFVLILPWNLEAEISAQMARIRAWGGRFAVPIPRLAVRP